MEIYLKNWYDKFLEELPRTKKLRIISPFVKEQILRAAQAKFNFSDFELITRFNLRDFGSNVSSLEGLKFSVESGAVIFGIRDLHSKVYLFDNRAAIVTSANFTSGGLINNYECGIHTTNELVIRELQDYFNTLKDTAGQKLTVEQCEQWQGQLSKVEVVNTSVPSLPDYGAIQVSTQIDTGRNYFVKFFGTSNDRVDLDFSIREEIDRALCNYACGFSINKKPRQVKEGDIIYMARLTCNPYDYAIFGKAEALKYTEGRDQATASEITERPWKEKWPIYLRVKNTVFIDGTMQDCVLLYDLMKSLDYMSFPSTLERYENGERNINPKRSLAQRAYIELTEQAVEWLEPKFQEGLNRKGIVPQSYLDSLPNSQF